MLLVVEWLTGPADQKPLLCRSELAREKPEGAAFIQHANVIVNDRRRQASSYSGPHLPLFFIYTTQAGR
jgi:hypothetical protein